MDEKEREGHYDRTRRKGRATAQWKERNKKYLDDYVDYVNRLQNPRILHYELLFSVVFLGLAVNLLASLIWEMGKSIINQNMPSLTAQVCWGLVIASLAYVIGLLFDKKMREYDPSPRSLYLPITLVDCANYRYDEETFDHIYNYLNSEKMIEFKKYSQRFFCALEFYYSHIFNPITPQMISEDFEYEIFDIAELFPTTMRAYDLTELATSGRKSTLEVILRPHIIYAFSEGRVPHVRGIVIDLKVDIVNPADPKADKLITELYWIRLGRIPEYASIAVEKAFHPLIDEINPSKIGERYLKERKQDKEVD